MEENQNQQNQNGLGWQQKMSCMPEKLPLWKQFLNSFCGARRYPQYLRLSSGSVVLYFFFLIGIITIFSVVVPTLGYLIGVGGVGHYINEKIPDFTLKDGVLSFDSTMEYESATAKLYLDTDVEEYTKKDVDDKAYMQILVSRSNILLYSNGLITNYAFKDFGDITFSKEQLLEYVPLIYVCIVLYGICAYLVRAVYALSTMLLLAVVGMFSNSMYQFGLKFRQLFTLALYSTTITAILEAVNTALHLVSGTTASMVGMLWSAFVFFSALTICGSLHKAGKLQI